MNLSLVQKMGMVFRYIFSSFLSIEMFVLSLLLFIILVVNLKRNNKIIQLAAIGVYLGFVIGIFISYTTYVQTCVDSFVKLFMNYVYFPSTVVYFFIMSFVSIMIIWTLFSKKLTTFKKVFNEIHPTMDTAEAQAICEEKYNLFHINIINWYGSAKEVIPGKTIQIDRNEVTYLPEIILTVICKIEGVNPTEILGDLDKNVEKIVNKAIKDINFGENIEI